MKTIFLVILVSVTGIMGMNGQSLDAFFSIAAENNPGLQSKYKDFEAAMQRVPQMRALPDPTLSFGYFISSVETRVGPQKARFSLSQMFPWFGTLKAKGDVAALEAEASYQSFLDARNKLYYTLAQAYYPLYELKQWKQIELENNDILQSYKTIANSKFENGSATLADVLRVDILLMESDTRIKILDKKEKPLLATFNNLINRNSDEAVKVSLSPPLEILSEDFSKDSLFFDNPLLKEIELKIEATQAAEKLARKQGWPNLGVGFDYVIVGEHADMNLTDSGKDILMPMISLSIPVFRSKYNAAIKEAQLKQESYTLRHEEFSNTLSATYENIWFQLQQHQELIKLYEQQQNSLQHILELLFTAYSNSGNDFEELLRTQQQLLKYRTRKATSETEYLIAVAHINYLIAKL